MEVKPKTVTFKFDVHEVNPVEVANDLVRFKKKTSTLMNKTKIILFLGRPGSFIGGAESSLHRHDP